ncbi:MAG: histidinol-phosphate transaminase [Anaerolineae bacterium]|nr:histidinol-phosphate transaminase [Anaerolineae bacterium]
MKGLPTNPHLLKVPLYVAGKSAEQVSRELGLDRVTKLCSNENPLGPSPMALAALSAALAETHRYPGIAESELREKLAAYHGNGLTERHFLVGNGATDVLRTIAQAFIFDGGESVTSSVAFPMYRLLTTMFGGKSVQVAPRPDYHLDLAAMAEAVTAETRIVWLCSPNNPTGFVLSQSETDEFMERLPEHVVVVFDEAYRDFVTDPYCADSIRYVLQGRNVVVVHSFSKSGGLANLRIGYGIASPDLIEYLLHTVMPFGTGALSAIAAAASLEDQTFRRRCRDMVWQERTFLHARLTEMGLTCLESQANFVLILDPPMGVSFVVDALLHQGIIVRPMAGFGLPNAFRVTVGTREENEHFLDALHVVLVAEQAVVVESGLDRIDTRHQIHAMSQAHTALQVVQALD